MLLVSSYLLYTDVNWSFKMLVFTVLSVYVIPSFALRGETPVESHFLLLMKLQKHLQLVVLSWLMMLWM